MIGHMIYFTSTMQPRRNRQQYRSVPDDFVRINWTKRPLGAGK